MSADNTLYLPFIDESEVDPNKVTVNEFSFQNYIMVSFKFLKKLRKLDKLTETQLRQAGILRESVNFIIAKLDELEKSV